MPNCPDPEGPQTKFRIPPGEKDRWIKACHMNEKDVNTLTRFCALHFREEDVKRGQERNFLRKGVVPSLDLHGEDFVLPKKEPVLEVEDPSKHIPLPQ